MKATTLNANFLISKYENYLDDNKLSKKKKNKYMKKFKLELLESIIFNTNELINDINKKSNNSQITTMDEFINILEISAKTKEIKIK